MAAEMQKPVISGYVERVIRMEIIGWVSVTPTSTIAPQLSVLLDGSVIARNVPTRRRPDVIAAGYGEGIHGFRIATPVNLAEVAPERLSVVVEPWGHTLQRSSRGNLRLRTTRRGKLDGIQAGAIIGWADDGEDKNVHETIDVRVNGRKWATVKADIERLDLIENGLSRADLGFRVELGPQYANATEIVVEAFYADGGGSLPGSPFTWKPESDARSLFSFVLGAVIEGLIDEEEGVARLLDVMSRGLVVAAANWGWLFESAASLGLTTLAVEAALRLLQIEQPRTPELEKAALALIVVDAPAVRRMPLPNWVQELAQRFRGGAGFGTSFSPQVEAALAQQSWLAGQRENAAGMLSKSLSSRAGRHLTVVSLPLFAGPAETAQANNAGSSPVDIPVTGNGGQNLRTSRQREEARAQRDIARTQRDRARRQRDEARLERDALHSRTKTLEAAVTGMIDAVKTAAQVVGLDVAPTVSRADGFSEIDVYRGEHQRLEQLPTVRAKRLAGIPLSVKELEIVHERRIPFLDRCAKTRSTPPKEVAFLTVANDKFLPGLEGMLLSMLEVYPDLQSDIYVFSDGSLGETAQSRLKNFYPNLHFVVPDMAWFDDVPQKSDNHKRIGKLGYMNIFGLTLEQYERVILLDSDILIIDDISALWQGDDFVVCYDCGDREYVAKSNYTSDFVFNSGVISIPKKHIGAAAFAEMKAIVMDSAREVCPLIDRFADQKAWNIFLRTRAKTVAAVNYNCNIKYVINSLGGRTEGVSIIHFAGPKPWAHKDYIHESLVEVRASKAARFDKLWLDHYRRLLYKTRLEQFRTYHDTTLRRSPVRNRLEDPGAGTCFMIGNGPSIQRTDMSILQDYEKFCYNWFILHKEFDIIRPEHLVLASHMFFGGWNVQEPKFPEGYYEKLMELKHRPVIWTSFVNREFFTNIGLDREFEVNYLMFEKPFKRFVDRVGVFRCDPSSFQDDARTGVISVGMVAASAMGFKRIALVGCDASYNRATSNSNYFYDEKLHTSLQTRSDSLTSTWEDGGRGQYVYKLAYEGLAERGIELVDCTVDGEIQHVPKVALEQFRVNPMKKVS